MTNNSSILWECDHAIRDHVWLSLEIPEWIDQDVTFSTIAAINQGGCESGAYMAAVTYHRAIETMSKHSCAIFDYLESQGEIPQPKTITGWGSLAVFYVSCAAERWAAEVEEGLVEYLESLEPLDRFLVDRFEPSNDPDLAAEIVGEIFDWLKSLDVEDRLDVRIQWEIEDGCLTYRSGHVAPDETDLGLWAYGTLSKQMSDSELRSLAVDMIHGLIGSFFENECFTPYPA